MIASYPQIWTRHYNWMDLSPDLQHVICALGHPDPHSRASIREALVMPFVTRDLGAGDWHHCVSAGTSSSAGDYGAEVEVVAGGRGSHHGCYPHRNDGKMGPAGVAHERGGRHGHCSAGSQKEVHF